MVQVDFSGNFTNPENCKQGDIGVVIDEGEYETKTNNKGKEYRQFSFEIEVNGKQLTHSPSFGEGKELQNFWGKESKNWIGKKFKISIVTYLSYGVKKQKVELEPIIEQKVA